MAEGAASGAGAAAGAAAAGGVEGAADATGDLTFAVTSAGFFLSRFLAATGAVARNSTKTGLGARCGELNVPPPSGRTDTVCG